MPATYPAREINGVMISGFVALDINKAVFPHSIIPILMQAGYRIDVDTIKARQDHDFLFQDLKETLKAREKVFDYFWKELDWDLFILIITGTDRLMHFLWDAYEEENHVYHQSFIDYFNEVDGFVGRIYDRFIDLPKDGQNQFYMLSDHGFTNIKAEVYLNRWLLDAGYLKLKKDQPETIMDIRPGSTAFVLDPSRVYINLKRKYPHGAVDICDYERIRLKLKEGLEGLTFDGNTKVIKKAFFKEELYNGAMVDQAPDLVVLSNDGFDLKGKVNSRALYGKSDLEGMHNQSDAFFYSSIGVECKTIFDAKNKILKQFLY
jgi:predicted AlkP superfamily phosphohydrolase/phosphomutase